MQKTQKMELIFATNNKHKIKEITEMVGNKIKILSLSDINCTVDLPETHNTIEENAIEKALYIYSHYGKNCFSDDSGLFVEALNNQPGVYSARYAGPQRKSIDNNNLLLKNLTGITNRKAAFRTIIALIINGEKHIFEGKINGQIAIEPKGTNGFGYDPLFIPDGYTKTFAELTDEEKNSLSHRRLALEKLMNFIQNNI